MNKQKVKRILGALSVLFLASIVISLVVNLPYGSTYDVGYTAGQLFGKIIRSLGPMALAGFGLRKIERYIVQRYA